jgi:hypothetical protein
LNWNKTSGKFEVGKKSWLFSNETQHTKKGK